MRAARLRRPAAPSLAGQPERRPLRRRTKSIMSMSTIKPAMPDEEDVLDLALVVAHGHGQQRAGGARGRRARPAAGSRSGWCWSGEVTGSSPDTCASLRRVVHDSLAHRSGPSGRRLVASAPGAGAGPRRSEAGRREGTSADHGHGPREPADRHGCGQHPVRPVGEPGLLRVLVPVPRQLAARLGARSGGRDYLYVCHLHRDHFDAAHLRRFVTKKATVLLPEYPTTELEDELRDARLHPLRQDRAATRSSSSTAASRS